MWKQSMRGLSEQCRSSVNVAQVYEDALKEAAEFQRSYEADVQFIFSHVQHHWHALDKDGQRVPLKYCRPKGKVKKHFFCKSGFPKKVCRTADGKICNHKYRVRVVCKGVAAEMQMKCSGRRNMLGAVLGKRKCEWFSSTSALLAHVFRSNTNLQTNYRLPIITSTHDKDCKSLPVSTTPPR